MTGRQRDELLEKLQPTGDGQIDNARLREVVVDLVAHLGPSKHSDAVSSARSTAGFANDQDAKREREGVTGKPGDGVAEKAARTGEGNSAVPGNGIDQQTER